MKMEMLRYFRFTFLGVFGLAILVHAQNQSGFISIDCGSPANTTYTDAVTGLMYTSDASFIETGVTKSVAAGYHTNTITRQQMYVRSFPQGDRNCYNITVTRGNKYLIRATFFYGNYDGTNILPEFDVHLGSDKWVNVKILNASIPVIQEIIHIVSSNYVYVCPVNTDSGVPFISALEFRPLKNTSYVTQVGSLVYFKRLDVGSITNQTVRYPDDIYDRLWTPHHFFDWTDISTTQTIDSASANDFQPPSLAMRSAAIPTNANESMKFHIGTPDTTLRFYVYMHFAEIVKLEADQSRHFQIFLNGYFFYEFTLDYLYSFTVYSRSALVGGDQFLLFRTEGSTQPPLLNAIEVYSVVELSQSTTDQGDVNAITSIKSTYGITRNWQGDPCAPAAYVWQGLNCSYADAASPRIISLNLRSSGLEDIAPDIANLKLLESLDLSNNSLSGSVPHFLSQLPSLKFLNLKGNKLTGTLPADLYARSQSGSLLLSVEGNPNLCPSVSCNKKKKSAAVPIVASFAGFFAIMAAASIFWFLKRRMRPQAGRLEAVAGKKHASLESKNRQFTYSEILQITKNFETVLGKGGFGTVYHGYLDGTEVAVKMLSPSSVQGCKEFQAEVKLLLRVHHRNLTSLVGYCDADTNMGLIYDYMANGNLKDHLSHANPNTISWEGRLRIAVEAAQGLEYLHNGCKPQIVHRDVKTSNILLDDKFQAKLSDFGLSRTFPAEGGTHVSTTVAGTPGYLDPEYYDTNWLTDRSDVYSFGVVLLEIVTSQPVIDRSKERAHISSRVSSMLQNGDVKSLVDRRLHGDYNINSVWKILELAMACLSATSAKRPTMSQVVIEINECLVMERAQAKAGNSNQSGDSIELITVNVQTELFPEAR